MIKVKLLKKNNNLSKVIINGHAMYDDFGRDIVCAAVSSTVITSINACLLLDNNSINYNEQDGVEIEILKDDVVTVKIINNMISILRELEKAYPKNVQIKEENNE